jgi:hypothetical protein
LLEVLRTRLSLAEISPGFVAVVVVHIIVFSILLAGILKCVQIARRPSAHSLSVYALLIVLTGMLAGGVLAVLARAQVAGLAGQLALVAIVLCMCVAGLVTAVIGLADFRKHRETYLQGLAQAKWAAALSVIFLIVSGGFIYWSLKPLLGNVAGNAPKIEARQPAAEDELIGSLEKPGFSTNSTRRFAFQMNRGSKSTPSHLVRLPSWRFTAPNRRSRLASRVQPSDERVTLEYRARRFAGRHPSKDYGAYYDDVRSAARLFDRPLTIQAGSSN